MNQPAFVSRLSHISILSLSVLSIAASFAKADDMLCQFQEYFGSYPTPDVGRDVAIGGTTAYIADGESGLQIIDVGECSNGCDADLIDDGVLDFYDVSAFLIGFRMQNEIADFTNDGVIDFFDVIAFLDAFADGCP